MAKQPKKRGKGRPKKVVKSTKSTTRPPKSTVPDKSELLISKVTPTKPSVDMTDDSLKVASLPDRSTPVSSNTQSSEQEHGSVNQDDTLKTAEKPPENTTKTNLNYKKVLLNVYSETRQGWSRC